MPTTEAFTKGFALIASCWPHIPMTPARMDAYHAVCEDMDDNEWELAVTTAIKSAREFPPAPGVLLSYGRPPTRASGAAERFEAIEAAYSRGEHLSARQVEERHGVGASRAFIACGGSAVFDVIGGDGMEQRRAFALKAFVESYAEETANTHQLSRADAAAILGGTMGALTAGKHAKKN